MYEYEEVRIKMDLIQKNLLEQVAGLHEIPEGPITFVPTEPNSEEIQLQILIL